VDAATITEKFIAAFSAADFDAMQELLAPRMISWVTGPDGQVERLIGRDDYLARVKAMDLPAADFSVELTQVPVAVGADLVLCMVEVKAGRSERTLHNFAGHLMRVDSSQIAEWWMVDAKPAASAAFWTA
jgi:hypothetical protein